MFGAFIRGTFIDKCYGGAHLNGIKSFKADWNQGKDSILMKNNKCSKGAFTLIELLVVLALVSLLGCLLLPAMARTHIRSSGSGCLSNYRQMMVGWSMYMDENDDIMVPNSQAGTIVGERSGWYLATVPNENWLNSDGNTNRADYLSGSLAPYIGGHVELYQCPGDVIPSQNGRRLKSCSMNSQVGAIGEQVQDEMAANRAEGWKEYSKGSDMTCPDPKDLFIFADESIWTVNDGWLEIELDQPAYPDCFAAYHDGAGGFSFADGHAEIHKWVGPYVRSATTPRGILGVVYQSGVVRAGSTIVTSSGSDQDWIWETNHASCRHP